MAPDAAPSPEEHTSPTPKPRPVVLAVLALAAVTVVAVVASGALDGGARRARQGERTTVAQRTPSSVGGQRARTQVMAVLHGYERAFSTHDVTAMAGLLTPDIFRHGLRGGSCAETRGRQAVAQVYQESFAAGPRARYRLADLRPSAINLAGSAAWVNSHYVIGPSRSPVAAGSVSFELREARPAWLISLIAASC